MTSAIFYLPALAQALATAVDEFYFHHRRRLGSWEIIGHPADTLSVLAAYVFLAAASPSATNLSYFIAIAVFSSLLVTKDEWVHAKACRPGENWLHAFLFIVHPIAFMAAGWIWWNDSQSFFFEMQSGVMLLFFLYQTIYWGFLAKRYAAR